MQSTWSKIRDFSNDDIFIVIFTLSEAAVFTDAKSVIYDPEFHQRRICILSWSDNPVEQIRALIGPVSINLANKVK
jgi:hypothetical protein